LGRSYTLGILTCQIPSNLRCIPCGIRSSTNCKLAACRIGGSISSTGTQLGSHLAGFWHTSRRCLSGPEGYPGLSCAAWMIRRIRGFFESIKRMVSYLHGGSESCEEVEVSARCLRWNLKSIFYLPLYVCVSQVNLRLLALLLIILILVFFLLFGFLPPLEPELELAVL